MQTSSNSDGIIEIIAFKLHEQEFCVRTITIREIRGWVAAMPLPGAPADVMGVMNLRGTVIPVINLATKLGMKSAEPTQRSAIVVTEVGGKVMGLLVDQVSDILTVTVQSLQPIPDVLPSDASLYCEGIIAQPTGMICFLNLERMFEEVADRLTAA